MARISRKNTVKEQPKETPLIMPRMATAAYARLSVEDEMDGDDSIKFQIEMLRSYIKEQPDLELTDTYVDNGYSGTNFDRPGFKRMMEDVKAGKIQCIVIKDLSRFGRDYIETGYYLETILPRLNVRMIAINDYYDSFRDEDNSTLSVSVRNMVNAAYAKDISKKISSAVAMRKKRTDVVPFGVAPYGYLISEERDRYIEDPETGKIVRTMVQWKRMGVSFGEIAHRLNKIHILPPLEYRHMREGKEYELKPWQGNTVRKVITHPVYKGDLILGRLHQSLSKNQKQYWTDPSEWAVTENRHTALVSRKDYEDILSYRDGDNCYKARFKKYNTAAREEMNDALKGLVYCRECGKQMNYLRLHADYSRPTEEELSAEERTWKTGTRRIDYYDCPPLEGRAACGGHKISADYLKVIVFDEVQLHIQALLEKKKLLDRIKAKNGKNPILSGEMQLTALNMKLHDNEVKILRLYEDYRSEILTQDDYDSLKAKYLAEKERIEEDAKKLRQEVIKKKRMLETFLGEVKEIQKNSNDDRYYEKIVEKLVERIYVSANGEIEIIFKMKDILSEIDESAGVV